MKIRRASGVALFVAVSPLVLLLPGLMACTGQPDAAETSGRADHFALDTEVPRQTILEVQTLEPGEIVEGIMTGGSADRAEIHLTATTQLDWNIHSHATGHAVIVHQESGETVADFPFVPTGNGDWFLLLQNSGNVTSDFQIRIDLFGNMQWRFE